MDLEFLLIPGQLLKNFDLAWTFVLLLARFTGLVSFIPGIGMGVAGIMVRAPAVIVLALTSLGSSARAPLPSNMAELTVQVASEFLLGTVIGLIPMLIVTCVQTAGHLASTIMGLQASQLIDPTLHISLPDIARIYGDIVIVIFLLIGGHHIAIYAASGLGGAIIPGTFLPDDITATLLVDRSADIFRVGVMLSAPVIVALLLTNFVMGLITKAVPTVNIFIVSFPLTIGIGLILSVLVLPELVVVASKELNGLEASVLRVLEETRKAL